MKKQRLEIWISIVGALLGIIGAVVSVLSYRQAADSLRLAEDSLKLARESEIRSQQTQDLARRLEVEQYLADAWDLLGGEVGTPGIQSPTQDKTKLELARRLIQDKAMLLDAENAKTHRYYGVYLYATGDFDGAVQAFEKALKFNPDDTASQFNMARVKVERLKLRVRP